MGIEVERKFLLKNDSWRDRVITESRMTQAYLANQGNASIRVRIAGAQAWLNIKRATIGIERAEFEYAIPLEDAQVMLERLVGGPPIDKTRYRVMHAGHLWEIDVFHGANQGLVVAELELGSAEESFALPDWVGEEVSQDARYYNVNLVAHPFRQW